MKTCNACRRELPATAEFFYRSKSIKCGLAGDCRDCRCKMSREWSKANAAKVREKKRAYYLKNRDRIIAASTKWNEDNLDLHRKYARDYQRRIRGVKTDAWHPAGA